MPSQIAFLIWLVLLVALLRLDPIKVRGSSLALWVPVAWLFITATRLPSQWLGTSIGYTAETFAEGNAFDRVVYFALIGLSLAILVRRSFKFGSFISNNLALSGLVLVGLVSVAWSDFPFIAFKRWFRDLGIYLVILVVLTDRWGPDAVRWVYRRVFFLAIPLSIILIKYFPHMAREYDQWTGQQYFTGAATSKNMLGVMCLVSGLYFLWDICTQWHVRTQPETRRVIWINASILAMTMWLLTQAGSATSTLCFAMGAAIILATHIGPIRRNPALLPALVPLGIVSYMLLQFAFGVDLVAVVSEAVGRQPDLTGRTNIWRVVLSTDISPLVGAGYESFWLGPRLLWVWERATGVNHAHNGYLELYLNLGIIGLAFLCAFLVGSYVSIWKRYRASPSLASYSLALWAVILFYNVTESAFRGQLLWLCFLMSVIVVPRAVSSSQNRRMMAAPPPRLETDAHALLADRTKRSEATSRRRAFP